ncbi:transglutaminase-like domain-containing protein [Sphingosinicella sp.]|uniref:transglutaminase-like domain-containing protein n=1 Tax=Sphingosinicella sp. TaxID=1917971 RepID=UPI0040383ADB
MRLEIDVVLDYHVPERADILLAVEVAQLPDQILIGDRLTVDGSGPLAPIAGEEGIGQRTWLTAEGRLRATYRAIVDLNRPAVDIAGLAAAPKADLPPLVVPYLLASRYCEADRFETFVERHFGAFEGGAKIMAMADWIGREMTYVPGSTDAETTAADAFVAREGVCRDYAHLMASFARAAGIPARLVSGYALDLDPPDFHAVVEVWLEDGWHLVDATSLAPTANVARICVGRDATDIAFMTIFGTAELIEQSVKVTRAD